MPSQEGAGPAGRSAAALVAHIADGGPALVALSGGVDSAVVAALAQRALGAELLAVTIAGSATSAEERGSAEAVAATLGLRHRTIEADPLSRAEYRANGADRCYHCRSVETAALRAVGATEGVRQWLDGLHVDDLAEERPGRRAMDEAGFQHPLLWGGWRKAEVRAFARTAGLPNAERPSNACLASRVARGEPVSRELLGRIERAERVLLVRGFRRVRVRTSAGTARLEVDPDELPRLEEPALLGEVTREIEALGFASVAVDPRGYPLGERLPTIR